MWQQLSVFLFYAGIGIAIVGFFLIGMPRTSRGDDYVTPIGNDDDARRSQQRRIKLVFIIAGVALLLIGLSVAIQVLT